MKRALSFIFSFAILNSTFLLAAPLSEIVSKDGSIMILIPVGSFTMGSTNADPDESPRRKVSLPAFYIDTYEVTHEQYDTFLKGTGRAAPLDWPDGSMPQKLAKHPVVNVTWHDAAAYATWAGKRLPTEAEWEKACRGTEAQVYPWAANKSVNSKDGKSHPEGRTLPVGSAPNDVSPYGVMDLAGNAWEWTSDWYRQYPGNDHFQVEYGNKYKVIRGGGVIDFFQAASTCRCADRVHSSPYTTHEALGFRCVKDVK